MKAALYIHIPWCIKKCPYCDFNSHVADTGTGSGELPEGDYVQALLDDLSTDIKQYGQGELLSIFIGGGTPSLFSARAFETLLEGIDQRLTIPKDCEITMEANPGTAEADRFKGYRSVGINRLSLGIQSLDDRQLKELGRIHNSDEALRAVAMARSAGFENINLDLMFGLPHQTVTEGLQDLRRVIEQSPAHLSWYQLTLEPNTVFYHKPPLLPLSDEIAELQIQGQDLLAERGYEQYEISAYGQRGYQCSHNRHYWAFDDYFGIGAGAHGKLTLEKGQVIRTVKRKLPVHYLNQEKRFLAEENTVPTDQLAFEYMLNCLRLLEPISFRNFECKTGIHRDQINDSLLQASSNGLVMLSEEGFTVTERGRLFLNDLVELFL